jgi:hypothetical protein
VPELKKSFFYISFSASLVYFIIKFLGSDSNRDNDPAFRIIVNTRLAEKNITLEQAKDLIRDFENITKLMKSSNKFRKTYVREQPSLDLEKINQIRILFNTFHHIRDDIVTKFGTQALQDIGDSIRKTGRPFPFGKAKKRSDFVKARYIAWIVDNYISFEQATSVV